MDDERNKRRIQLLIDGWLWHLTIDWFFQNDWMAAYKTSLRHQASWIHSGMHGIAQLAVFPWRVALGIAVAHIIIDTRVPLLWWRRTIRQTTDSVNPMSRHVAIWQDQVAHILVLALASWWTTRKDAQRV